MSDKEESLSGTISFYENYFKNRVTPKMESDMAGAEGLYAWLLEYSPELYQQITQSWDEINSLWANRADHDSFRAACKLWRERLLEAKERFDAHKARLRAEALQPDQASMALR